MLREGMFIDNETGFNFIEDDESPEYTHWVTVDYATYPDITPNLEGDILMQFLSDHMRHNQCRIDPKPKHHDYPWVQSIPVYAERDLDKYEVVAIAIEQCNWYAKEIREGRISVDQKRIFRGGVPTSETLPPETSVDLEDRILDQLLWVGENIECEFE
ncbi:hypothetical protein N7541_001584 [Penicillium brevicompactum]|uniref:Uncharacterized protein n=1 Tax=Penicillium brevicompactum TaxID=5074 RepID=A0A9W9V3L0_PENBR|nr:hypothetical protein N7541_001584 [Penicillium brevicompactum]